MILPLTAEEEATLRRDIDRLCGPASPTPSPQRYWMDRLLATLAARDGALQGLVAAASLVIVAGVSNRSGDKYQQKVRAFDALDDALEIAGPLALRATEPRT